ncbi:MAG TPA: aminotransferase class III-fold pyridoxal phosphate-dependent enzyme [Rhizomicrobium sp.]|jgi:beta-alanine--pyruvate transaminase|nr:aminotransferase class III-fold pyridoxal phosphate-dependent enzyme [Rhizomicrobium sp.]
MRQPNDLSAFWLPFTPNRHFKMAPRLLTRAEGMYYYDDAGRALLDSCAGLWCVNAGHGRKPIADAIARAAHNLDFAPTFQFAHPDAFALAQRIAALAPDGLEHVFFVNSGSEACDAALKVARAYFQKTGQGGRFRLIGREKGYHGVTFAGISVGGLGNNRRPYGPLLPGTDDHLPLPYDASMRFTRGEPQTPLAFADQLEKLVQLHGAETIAAVIVEPMAGSAGVFPTSAEYLKRLRTICDRHGILLIFDEVITAFGRLGHAFAAERYGVTPDIITFAKAVSNGAVPMGGIVVSSKIHDAFMGGADHQIELFHGHTYSAHPLACAAALATLNVYRDDGLFHRARKLEPVLQDAVHELRGAPFVMDIRNVGMAAAIELEPDPVAPGRRGYDIIQRAFHDENLVVRVSGDTIALSPPLIATESDLTDIVERIRSVLHTLS